MHGYDCNSLSHALCTEFYKVTKLKKKHPLRIIFLLKNGLSLRLNVQNIFIASMFLHSTKCLSF